MDLVATREIVGGHHPHSWPQRILTGTIRIYQLTISPWLGPSCRFEPTCSGYAVEAIERHGASRGAWLSIRRMVRCHPLGASGHDPVP